MSKRDPLTIARERIQVLERRVEQLADMLAITTWPTEESRAEAARLLTSAGVEAPTREQAAEMAEALDQAFQHGIEAERRARRRTVEPQNPQLELLP